VARDRKSAKQRQAERRARRLEQAGDGDARRSAEERGEPGAQSADTPEAQFELEASAPPEELGRSDMVLEPAPDEPDLDPDDHLQEDEVVEAIEEETGERPKPARDGGGKERGRVLTFLANVWAELQRVQWPNRQQVTTLTGVVIGFVLIAGGYLGLLDAIFSRVIEAIL
jgi:preprotein translocase subunit SecE